MNQKLKILSIATFISIFLFNISYSQNVAINATGTPPDASSMLDISSANSGLLIPRVALLATNNASPVTTPATSLLVYNTATVSDVTPGYYFWDGTKWVRFQDSSTADDWHTDGNSGTTNGTHFIGTTDAQSLDIRTNNIIRTRITQKGQIETLNTGLSVFVGEGAGTNDDLSDNINTYLGYQTGYSNSTGANNVAIGNQSLYTSSIGDNNIAIGNNALYLSNNRSGIIAIGESALYHNSFGSIGLWEGLDNIAVGKLALYENTRGYNNVALGNLALRDNTTGYYNCAIGYRALENNETGSNNSSYGGASMSWNTTGSMNAALGYVSLFSNTSGNYNVALGSTSLYDNTTGSNNTAVGYMALNKNKANNGSVAIGYFAMYYADDRTTGRSTYNTAIGYEALRGSATASNNTGQYNTCTGYQTLYSNTTGSYNSAHGYQALNLNTTGWYNVALGYRSLPSNTSGGHNFASGALALNSNTSGWFNIAIGSRSLFSNSTSSSNIAIGYYALNLCTGSGNQGIGYYALSSNTTGNFNIAFGYQSGDNITTGSRNIIIGHDIDAPIATDNNQMSIGNLIFGTGIDGTGTTISSGNIGIATNAPTNRFDVDGQIRMRTGSTANYIIEGDANGVMSWVDPNTALNDDAWLLTGNSGTTNGTHFIGTTDAQSLDIRTNNIIRTRITQKGQIETLNTGQSVFIGEGAGANDDLSLNRNVFIGYNSGNTNSTGAFNTAIGYNAMNANTTGSSGIAIGYGSLSSNNIGFANIAIGYLSLEKNTTAGVNIAIGYEALQNNSSGTSNIGVGYCSLINNLSGSFNTAFGNFTIFSNTTGNNNTAFGYNALRINTIGLNNIAIGYQAGNNITTGSNNLIFGYDIDAPVATGSNQMSIGNLIFGTGIDGTGTTVSSGNIGIATNAPTNKFDVDGQIRMRTGSTANYIIEGDANGVMSWVDPNTALNDDAWLLTGNSGTSPATNFIGTTDAQSLAIRTNNTERMRILSGGNVGINTTIPNTQFHVNGALGIDPFRIQTNGSTKMFMSSAGYVAIGGFFVPNYSLEVIGNSAITTTSSSNTNASGTGIIASGNNQAAFYLVSGTGVAFTGNDGVYGKGAAATGTGIIASGNNQTPISLVAGSGVSGNGTEVGVYGLANSATGAGVLGQNNNASGWAGDFQGHTKIGTATTNIHNFWGYLQSATGSDAHRVVSAGDNFGYVGFSGRDWWYGYAVSWTSTSNREEKRDITYLDGKDYEMLMKDIENTPLAYYKFKVEEDEFIEGKEAKYAPKVRLGTFTDEAPDYVQDNTFSGISLYEYSSLIMAGVKYNRNSIKKIEQKISDFGIEETNSNSFWVSFSEDFAHDLGNTSIPVITVTAINSDAVLYVSDISNHGFKVNTSSSQTNIKFNWIAMAKVENKSEISEEELESYKQSKQLAVDNSTKQLMKDWAQSENDRVDATNAARNSTNSIYKQQKVINEQELKVAETIAE